MIMGIDEFMVVITIAMTIVKMYIHKNVDSSVFLVQPLFPGFPFLKKSLKSYHKFHRKSGLFYKYIKFYSQILVLQYLKL